MKTTRGELRLLEGLVLLALAMAVIGTIVSIRGPFEFGGPGGLITEYGETVEVQLRDRCDTSPLAGGRVGFGGVCTAPIDVGGSSSWNAPFERPAFALARIGTGVLAVCVLYLLLRIVRTLRAGDPFVAANARRLTVMGFLVAVGGIVLQAVRTAAEMAVIERVDRLAPGVVGGREFELSFLPVAAGLLLVGLAEVFRQGARLREDVEGLV